jgi:hypothetical protein
VSLTVYIFACVIAFCCGMGIGCAITLYACWKRGVIEFEDDIRPGGTD